MSAETTVKIFETPTVNQPISESIKEITSVVNFFSWSGIIPAKTVTNGGRIQDFCWVGCRAPTFIGIITVIVQLAYLLYTYYELFHETMTVAVTVLTVLDYFAFFVTCILVPRITFYSLPHMKRMLNHLISVQDLWHNHLGMTKRPYLLFTFLTLLLLASTATTIFQLATGHGSTSLFNETLLRLKLLVYPLAKFYDTFTIWVVPVQLYLVCRLLARHFAEFSTQIENHFSTCRMEFPPALMSTMLQVCVHLKEAAYETEAYFSLSLFLFVTCRLANLIRGLHIFVEEIWSSDTADRFNIALDACNDFGTFLLVIWASDSMNAAINDCKRKMERLSYFGSSTEESLRLQWFRIQVLGLKVNITGGGMFNIGKRIIPPVLGVTATYFFIVLQYSRKEY